jgi:hypothetical protein
MSTAKDQIREILKRQPDGSSYDEIVRELAFDLMAQRALKTLMRAALFQTTKCSAG